MAKLDSYVDSNAKSMFCIFLLSRGVYDLNKQQLESYPRIVRDATSTDRLESWMEFDRLYLLDVKALRAEVANETMPYEHMLDIASVRGITLVDGKQFIVALEYEDSVELLKFDKIIEAWKFYNYASVLCLNAVEEQNSLCFPIKMDLRVLFNETRFHSMMSVFLAVVDSFSREYKSRTTERAKKVTDDGKINFKAITEFYELFLTAYYSLPDYAMHFDKLRVFINKLHEMYFDFIKGILENAFSEIQVIYDILQDSIAHVVVMRKWSIVDARFTTLFTYLTHAYKLRFFANMADRITTGFIDAYNSPQFYVNGTCTLIDSFTKFLAAELKTLEKLKKNDIFESMYLEIVRRALFLFFRQLLDTVKHDSFSMDVGLVNQLVNELADCGKQLRSVLLGIHKSFGYPMAVIEAHTRIAYIESVIDEIVQMLLLKLLVFVRPVIFNSVNRTSLADFSMKKICSSITAAEVSIKCVHAKIKPRYTVGKYDIILEALTQKLIDESARDIKENIEAVKNGIVSHLKAIASTKLEDQIVYIEQLSSFFTSNDKFKCQIALSCIQKLLTTKLSKKTLLDLIQKKKYSSGANLRGKLECMVSQHFTDVKKFNKRQESKRKANKKLVTIMNAILFVIRFKALKRSKLSGDKTLRRRTRAGCSFLNQSIDLEAIFGKIPTAVKFQVVSKPFMRMRFKGYTISDV